MKLFVITAATLLSFFRAHYATASGELASKRAITATIDLESIGHSTFKESIEMDRVKVDLVVNGRFMKLRFSPKSDQESTPTPSVGTTATPSVGSTKGPIIWTTETPEDIMTTKEPVTTMAKTEPPTELPTGTPTEPPTRPAMTDWDINDLMDKCGAGDIFGIQWKVEKFGDAAVINSTDSYQRTCLHLAVLGGRNELILFLGKMGADMNQRDNYGKTALHYASSRGYSLFAESLIGLGAETDPKDKENATPLRIAIVYSRYSIITTLIEHGASLQRAKESSWEQTYFDSNMKDKRTLDAIAEGQRLAGQTG